MSRLLCAFALWGATTAAQAGVPLPRTLEEELTDDESLVVAVTVRSVQPAVGTRAHPPRVILRVNTVIRGSLGSRSAIDAVWLPPPFYSCDTEGCSPPPEWLAEPVAGPQPGARMILLLGRFNGEFQVPESCRLPDTPQKRAYVHKAIADGTAARRRAVREYLADRDARLKSWHRASAPSAIARSARDADFVGIGRLSSGPYEGRATFIITKILKGVPRAPYQGQVYFADVPVPQPAVGVLGNDMDVFVFLAENGMELGGTAPRYTAVGEGVVLVDASARTIVMDAIRSVPERPHIPFCVVIIANGAESLRPEERRNRERLIADTFASAGAGRCTIATTPSQPGLREPRWAAEWIGKVYLGTAGVVLATIDHHGEVAFTGVRIRSDAPEIVFSDESWPEAVAEQHAAAVRWIERLITLRQ